MKGYRELAKTINHGTLIDIHIFLYVRIKKTVSIM